jgi:ABC-type phosphate/phosphonate transport system substrate-binding protein
MKTSRLLAALAGTMLVTACGNSNDAAEDRMETAAEA